MMGNVVYDETRQAMNGAMTNKPRIEHELDEMHAASALLNGEFSALFDKLGPVVGPDRYGDETREDIEGDKEEMVSTIAENIRTHTHDLRRMTRQVAQVRERLEC